MAKYKIANSNGLTGGNWRHTYETLADAKEALQQAMSWDGIVLSEHFDTGVDGEESGWCAYETQEECNADAGDGANAVRIETVSE